MGKLIHKVRFEIFSSQDYADKDPCLIKNKNKTSFSMKNLYNTDDGEDKGAAVKSRMKLTFSAKCASAVSTYVTAVAS